ncbi:MAG: ribosome small subunit-dependent GTPase A [Ruminococcaceae bacterium]|nr:ribosome small subunit-dependent GTPase A [Oscillospiraceae bacterium]
MQNKYTGCGIVTENVGGLYSVSLDNDSDAPLSGKEISCSARGVLRHREERPKVGDRVKITYSDHSFSVIDGSAVPSENGADIYLTEICERKNVFIRPPVANLDYLFLVLSSRSPQTLPLVADKMISISEHNRVEPVIIVSKCDLDKKSADELYTIYKNAGFSTYAVSSEEGSGIAELSSDIEKMLSDGRIAAFAGASGVGKSTLMNKLFPHLGLQTYAVSRKTERGRHTTRAVTLYPVYGGFLADTPGFSMLDFERFDFFTKDELLDTFRDFKDYTDNCRYADCTHTKEEGCAVLEAVRQGKISASRHESYLDMYNVLKQKPAWKK